MVDLNTRLDGALLLSLVIRAVIALFVGFALGFVGWLIAWLIMPFFPSTAMTFPIVGSVVLGFATAVGPALAFWDPRRSRKTSSAYVVLVFGAAVVSGLITYAITSNNPHYTFVTRGIVFPMINAGALTSTAVAAAFFAFRVLSRRELL